MDKRQFLEETIERVLSLDVSSVLGKYLSLQRRGDNYLAICPFHNDRKIGSFVANNNKGIFKCFACDEGGNSLHFVSKYRGINYVEAAFEIALDFSLITDREYQEYYLKRRYTKSEVSNIQKIYLNKTEKSTPSEEPLSIDIRNKVYNMFLDELSLSNEHRDYLRVERLLNDEIIEKRRYKTYPTPSAMKRLVERMNKEEMDTEKILSRMPGFFQKKEKHEWVWQFPWNKGLLIPIRDFAGRIEAMQIRRDKKDEDSGRYIWLSSSFASYNEKFKYGASSRSPIDVVYPESKGLNPSSVLFITEGRFKSETIANKFNSVSISVQGVGNWKDIDNVIKNTESLLRGNGFGGFKYIYIAFDSDMKYNYPIYHQLKNMSDFIKESFPNKDIYYLHWESELKGIDDLLFNVEISNSFNYREVFNKISKEYWDKEYSRQINRIMKKRDLDNPMLLDSRDLKKIIIGEDDSSLAKAN